MLRQSRPMRMKNEHFPTTSQKRVPSPRMEPDMPKEMEHPPTASILPLPMKTETENEPLPFGINDLMNVTKPFLDTRHRDVLYEVDSTMARNEPATLRLFVNNYREKFEAACLHGWHKRITRVELAQRLIASRVYFSGLTFLVLAKFSLDRGVPPPS